MCRIASDVRGFNNMETRAVIKFFFLQNNAPKEIHAILIETLGEHAPSYATVKIWLAQFGDFSTCDKPRHGRPKIVTTPDFIDKIHELILKDRTISAKSIAEQLGISCERVGSILHEHLAMRKLAEVRHFVSDAEVCVAAETWLDGQHSEFVLSGLLELEQRAKKRIELRGVYVE